MIGQPEIQSFAGAVTGRRGEGWFVTTARFSQKAKNYAKEHPIILLDGGRLAKRMIEYNFCVSTGKPLKLKRLTGMHWRNTKTTERESHFRTH